MLNLSVGFVSDIFLERIDCISMIILFEDLWGNQDTRHGWAVADILSHRWTGWCVLLVAGNWRFPILGRRGIQSFTYDL